MSINPQPIRKSFFYRVRQRIYPFFWFVAAADETLLHECPIPEQDKQAGVGMAIICTTIAAIISSYYAIDSLFASWPLAILMAFFWGIIIFNLDRFMVGSIRKDKHKRWWMEIKIALPRIALAFLIAILISKPLEVKIFQNQIQEAKSSFTDSLQSTKFKFESGELGKGRGERENAKEYLDQVTEESKEVNRDAAYRQYKNDFEDCIKEKTRIEYKLDMRKRQRLKAINRQEKEIANRLKIEIQNLNRQVTILGCSQKKKQMDDRAEAYIQSNLGRVATAQQRFDKISSRVDSAAIILNGKREDAGEAIENASKDILGQLRILKSLKEKDNGMMWASLLITTLFFILEVAPMLVKILSPRGEYDSLIAIAEKNAFDNEEAANEESNQKKIFRKKAAFNNTLQVEEIDEKVKQQVQEKILNAQADLAGKIVEAWKHLEETELKSNSAEYLNNMITKTS